MTSTRIRAGRSPTGDRPGRPPNVDEPAAARLESAVARGDVDSVVLRGDLSPEAFPGWQLKGWVVGLAFGAFVATLFLSALGPPNRRATPWAWFWLLHTPFCPLVAVALLVLGYRTPFLPPGREGRRGLTGGWAFLLSLVLGAASTR